jgi:hypothetical protein
MQRRSARALRQHSSATSPSRYHLNPRPLVNDAHRESACLIVSQPEAEVKLWIAGNSLRLCCLSVAGRQGFEPR